MAYNKSCEANFSKESMRSFLHSEEERETGVLTYRSRCFSFANQASKELIKNDPNLEREHPVSKALRTIAEQAQSYRVAQKTTVVDSRGQELVLSASPNLDRSSIVITVCRPGISDMVKNEIRDLKDPSDWDYLLYLQTTKPGIIINQMIPGKGRTLLNFKIQLLKASLSKKAILLDMPDEDMQMTVEALHHVSMRQVIHPIELTKRCDGLDNAIKLFGLSPAFGSGEMEMPLLQKLDKIGTLFIKNVELLEKDAQQGLAEFIQYGSFSVLRSSQKIASNVRVVCSSSQDLQQLVHKRPV